MTTTITFPLPAKALTMNQRLHWHERSRLARDWRHAAGYAALGYRRMAQDAKLRPSWVQVSIPVPDRRRRDPHNYAPTLKHVVDGLVDAGLWPDDTPEWVTTVEPELRYDRGGPVIVTIWPREPQVTT